MHGGRIWRLAVAAAVAVTAVAVTTGGPARADSPTLPPGWSIVATANGPALAYDTHHRVPIGAARTEVRLGGKVLGGAHEVGSRVMMPIHGVLPNDLRSLSAWRGSVRLDGVRAPAAPTAPARAEASAAAARAEAPLPPAASDPGTPGPFATERLSYSLPPLSTEPFPAPVEVLAEVTAPVGRTTPAPLVVILHGRHGTCFQGGPNGQDSGDWPCPPGWQPIPSYQGYRATADLLASQGYLAVSISANGINGQDFAAFDGGSTQRSQLVRHHLALWAQWNASASDPWGGRFRGKVDLSEVVLIGHSRGGEGVARATIDSNPSDPWRITGLVLIGPTAFGRQVPAYVHTAVLLPYCDGDVSDLQGQAYVDGARDLAANDPSVRSALLVMGANHNFFNTEWTPGTAAAPSVDDWGAFGGGSDPQCDPATANRLTPAQQVAVGATYSAALVRLATVGGESASTLLNGAAAVPPSAAPATVYATAIGARRTPLYVAGGPAAVRSGGAASAVECIGYDDGSGGLPCDRGAGGFARFPHFDPSFLVSGAPATRALQVTSTGEGRVRIVPPAPVDLTGASRLTARVIADPKVDPATIGLLLVDASGAKARLSVTPSPLPALPGSPTQGLAKLWARELRAPLGSVTIDLSAIVELDVLTGPTPTSFFVLDAWGVRNGVDRNLPDTPLPRVEVGTIEVSEPDASGTVDVPVTVTPPATGPASVFIGMTDPLSGQGSGHVVSIPVGVSSFTVPVNLDVVDDDVWTGTRTFPVFAAEVSGATTGAFLGGVSVLDDEPAPTLTAKPVTSKVVEGAPLRWKLTLSQPLGSYFLPLQFVAPAGNELSSDDVPTYVLGWIGASVPPEPTPLSQLGAFPYLTFGPGVRSQVIEIPTVADGRSEGTERVELRAAQDDPIGGSLVLKGMVSDG